MILEHDMSFFCAAELRITFELTSRNEAAEMLALYVVLNHFETVEPVFHGASAAYDRSRVESAGRPQYLLF
jgi:hypothetical protein